jgi:fructokinase
MILCCGEALIDMLPRETTQAEQAFAPYPGGAVFNTAIALGRLGAPVEFLSGLSSDFFGNMLRQSLIASGVGTSYAHVSAKPTTMAFVRLTNGQASYLFYDEGTAGRMLTEADMPPLGAAIQAMLFGAISLISEPCGSAYEALLRREQAERVIMLDPNIRPGFIADADSHRARIRRMTAQSDIVKFSDEDLGWFDATGTLESRARAWLDRGAKLVLVTRGADGAMGVTRNATVEVPAPKVTVVDTVGAGDTFNAGVLASLNDQDLLNKSSIANIGAGQIRTALELGVQAAAVTVSRAGANPPWRRELS